MENLPFPRKGLLGLLVALIASGVCGTTARAQRERGELRLEVRDSQGAMLAAAGQLVSQSNQFLRTFEVGSDGHYAAQDLPFGVYRLTLNAAGFAPWSKPIEIRSEVPVRLSATLGVAPVTTQVEVSDAVTLVDGSEAAAATSVGKQSIDEQIPQQAGR